MSTEHKPHSRDVLILEDALDRFAAFVPGGDHKATYDADCDACIAKDALKRLVEQLEASRQETNDAEIALDRTTRMWRESQEQLEAACDRADGNRETISNLQGYMRRDKQRIKDLEEQLEAVRQVLEQIAGPTPTSHRKTVDQLTDAVKWRQGMARDALTRLDSSPAIIPSSGVAVGYPAESGSARSYANREPERAASDPAKGRP